MDTNNSFQQTAVPNFANTVSDASKPKLSAPQKEVLDAIMVRNFLT